MTAVRVVRSDSHFPADVDDGVTIYEGLGTDIDDANLVSAKGYYILIARTCTRTCTHTDARARALAHAHAHKHTNTYTAQR